MMGVALMHARNAFAELVPVLLLYQILEGKRRKIQ